jgi:hypothetical protein
LACSRPRSGPRTGSGDNAHWCLRRPDSRSTRHGGGTGRGSGRLARDERAERVGLHPPGGGPALAGGGSAASSPRAWSVIRRIATRHLARRRLVRTALHVGGLANRDDRPYVARLALAVDRSKRSSPLSNRGRVDGEPALARLVALSISGSARMDSLSPTVRTFPRERKVGGGADGHIELAAVEPAALAHRDGRAMAPRGVRVGELRVGALAAALRRTCAAPSTTSTRRSSGCAPLAGRASRSSSSTASSSPSTRVESRSSWSGSRWKSTSHRRRRPRRRVSAFRS